LPASSNPSTRSIRVSPRAFMVFIRRRWQPIPRRQFLQTVKEARSRLLHSRSCRALRTAVPAPSFHRGLCAESPIYVRWSRVVKVWR
jgi:hypothetical protein